MMVTRNRHRTRTLSYPPMVCGVCAKCAQPPASGATSPAGRSTSTPASNRALTSGRVPAVRRVTPVILGRPREPRYLHARRREEPDQQDDGAGNIER